MARHSGHMGIIPGGFWLLVVGCSLRAWGQELGTTVAPFEREFEPQNDAAKLECKDCEECCVLIKKKTTVVQAGANCQDLSPDLHLLDIPDETQFDKTIQALRKLSLTDGQPIWTGGASCDNGTFWRYSRQDLLQTFPEKDNSSEKCRFLALDLSNGNNNYQGSWNDGEDEGYALCCQQKESGTGGTPGTPSTSSSPSTTTPRTTTVPADSTEYCQGELSNGMYFHGTVAGLNSTVNCSEGYLGNATWSCKIGPKFEESGPEINCLPKWMIDLEEDLNNHDKALNVSEILADKTKAQMKNGREVQKVIEILEQLTKLSWKDEAEKKNFTDNVLNATSNLIDENKSEGWKDMSEAERKQSFGQVMNAVETLGQNYIEAKDRRQYSQESRNFSKRNLDFEPMDVPMEKATYFPSQKGATHLRFLPDCGQACSQSLRAVGVLYKTASTILSSPVEGSLNSQIIGFSLRLPGIETPDLKGSKVRIVLQKTLDSNWTNPKCVFWHEEEKNWSSDGCERISFNADKVVCECDHLTNFAILMTRDETPPKLPGLEIITFICCGLSILSLILTIACLTGFRTLRCRRSTITCNLCAALLAVNCLILVGLNATTNKTACFVITMALHYSLLSSVFWMLLEGFLLYQMVVVVFNTVLNIPIAFFYAAGYGFPLLIVAVTAGVRNQSYVSEDHCWLGNKNGEVYSFLGPLGVMIAINAFIFVIAMKTAIKVRHQKIQKTQANTSLGWVKGAFSMMCLLGTTWLLTYFYFGRETDFILYIFNILNASQGFFIFLMNVIFNEKSWSTLVRFYRGKLYNVGSSQGTLSSRTRPPGDGSRHSSRNTPSPVKNSNIHQHM